MHNINAKKQTHTNLGFRKPSYFRNMAKRKNSSNSYGSTYKRYKQCGYMVASDASKALAIARKLRALINVEYKTVQVTLPTAPTTVAVVTHLSACGQNDDLSGRDGRKIKAFSIQVMGSLKMHETATATSTRIVVFIDHANQGTIPTLATWWDDEASFFNGEMRAQSPQTNARFIVIFDKLILQSDSGTKLTRINFYKRLNHHITYTGTTAADEGLGTVWIMIASSEATNKPTLCLKSTFKWIDN